MVVTAFMANSHRLSFINEDQDENKDKDRKLFPFGENGEKRQQPETCNKIASTIQQIT